MHKLESLALSCGSKIEKPYIHKSYYPIIDNNFICVSQQSDFQSNTYDYLNDVIFHINPYLKENKTSIIEVGNSKLPPLYYTKDYRSLNNSQLNYLISKSKAYFGNFNYTSHISSAFNIPTVCPTRNTFIELEKPYWSDNNCSIINSTSKQKPTFSDTENPKTINSIHPEVIACKILDLLNIKHDLNKIKTVFIGSEYNQTIVDLVPGDFSPHNINVDGILNVRMDKNFDLKFLDACSSIEPFNIVTDKSIPLNLLKKLSQKITSITYFIDNKTSLESVFDMEGAGKPINLLTQDKKNIAKIRLNFLDYQVREFGSLNKESLNDGNYSDLKFLSKRNIIFKGKAYNSYSSIKSGLNAQEVKYSKEFMEDLPFCRVYKKNT